jgi:hypothetical protein
MFMTVPSSLFLFLFNLPAGIAFISTFGKFGPEWGYFVCVFAEWFWIGAVLGFLKSLAPLPLKD